MHRMLKMLALSLVLVASIDTSLAASKSAKIARCDGKSRHPANIYGTILPSVDPVAGTVVPGTARPGGVEVFPLADPTKPEARVPVPTDGKPAPLVPPISSLRPSSVIRSC